jgi:hypothetical protein
LEGEDPGTQFVAAAIIPLVEEPLRGIGLHGSPRCAQLAPSGTRTADQERHEPARQSRRRFPGRRRRSANRDDRHVVPTTDVGTREGREHPELLDHGAHRTVLVDDTRRHARPRQPAVCGVAHPIPRWHHNLDGHLSCERGNRPRLQEPDHTASDGPLDVLRAAAGAFGFDREARELAERGKLDRSVIRDDVGTADRSVALSWDACLPRRLSPRHKCLTEARHRVDDEEGGSGDRVDGKDDARRIGGHHLLHDHSAGLADRGKDGVDGRRHGLDVVAGYIEDRCVRTRPGGGRTVFVARRRSDRDGAPAVLVRYLDGRRRDTRRRRARRGVEHHAGWNRQPSGQ